MRIEKFAYLMLRFILVVTGCFWILITLSSHFITPTLLYDYMPGPPPLAARLPQIVASIAIGLLFCVPNRWCDRGYLFWGRLAADTVPAGLIITRSLEDIRDRLAGSTNTLVVSIPLSLFLIAIMLALPLSLLWRRRLDRELPTQE